MANKYVLCLLLCIVLICDSVNGKYGRGSFSNSRGSSRSRGWGSSSRSKPSYSSHYYPSSHGLSGSGSSKHSYPSSSGLSGGSSAISYPTSGGLSGSGGGSQYPPSSGLSGSNSGRIIPWSTGVSSSGSASKYPPSTGLSGSGGSRLYPPSSGLSGGSSGRIAPRVTSTSSPNIGFKYTPLTGLSGSSGNNYYSGSSSGISSYNTHYSSTNFHKPESYNPKPPYISDSYRSNVYTPTYYTSPQHVYITQYRDSGSRYNDLLTGLTLYNLGRSHSNYHHHYYNDDYYRNRYNTGYSSNSRPALQSTDKAHCLLRVKENDREEILKIPCEIVSTFTEGSRREAQNKILVENTVCQNFTTPNNIPKSTSSQTLKTIIVTSSTTEASLLSVIPVKSAINRPSTEYTNTTVSLAPSNISEPFNATLSNNSSNIILGQNKTALSTNNTQNNPIITNPMYESLTTNVTSTSPSNIKTEIVNCTTTTTSQIKDPLTIKGPPIDSKNMTCEVEIVTKDNRLRSKVDCLTLMKYSKMPEPKKDPRNLPSRDTLKSWLSKPPWWLSLFIVV